MSGSKLDYLDAAATAPLRAEAREAMIAVLGAQAGNPSSVHAAGYRARSIVEEARERIAAALGARPAEVIFTAGGTEANNLAVTGIALASSRGRHIVTSQIEHPSVLESCRYLARRHDFEISEIAVDEWGAVDPKMVTEAVRRDTALVTIGLANGEVGTVQAVPEIGDTVRAGGVPMHTDAVQAAASLPVSFAATAWPGASVDALSIAAHKFGGPQGAGALLLRGGIEIEPVLHGGGQERGLRSGTENVAAIAGFAAAVEASVRGIGQRAMALANSRDELVRRVLDRVPGMRLTGHPQERLPGHASFLASSVSGESLLVALDAAGIAASSGSACAAGHDEPSPVLLAMGIEGSLAQTAIRFTLAEPIESQLIDRIAQVIAAEVAGANRGRLPRFR